MDQTQAFADIAPYQDHDVRPVLDELKKHEAFLQMLRFANIEASREELLQLVNSIDTILDFQTRIVKPWLQYFFAQTTSGITYEGIDALDPGQKCLFISNHRDIILDSALLNMIFNDHHIQTVEIAIGDNLLKSGLVKAVTKLNKIFTVVRDASPREMYKHSLTLSAYIRHKITTNDSSIWLAQREGRAKDGNDKTQQGLIKMLHLSNKDSFEAGFKALHIRPMSLSYEYDPCDRFKLKELLAREEGVAYEKEENEDYLNIEAGIREYKGRVHLCIQPELDEEIDRLQSIQNINDKSNELAASIDKSIYRSYKLFENNYVAHDLLQKAGAWQTHYSQEKKEEFLTYVDGLCQDKPPQAREILLRKYAYPLVNQLKGQA